MISVSPCAENLFKEVGPTSPVNIYMSKSAKETVEKGVKHVLVLRHRNDVIAFFVVNFEHISQIFLFLLLL